VERTDFLSRSLLGLVGKGIVLGNEVQVRLVLHKQLVKVDAGLVRDVDNDVVAIEGGDDLHSCLPWPNAGVKGILGNYIEIGSVVFIGSVGELGCEVQDLTLLTAKVFRINSEVLQNMGLPNLICFLAFASILLSSTEFIRVGRVTAGLLLWYCNVLLEHCGGILDNLGFMPGLCDLPFLVQTVVLEYLAETEEDGFRAFVGNVGLNEVGRVALQQRIAESVLYMGELVRPKTGG